MGFIVTTSCRLLPTQGAGTYLASRRGTTPWQHHLTIRIVFHRRGSGRSSATRPTEEHDERAAVREPRMTASCTTISRGEDNVPSAKAPLDRGPRSSHFAPNVQSS